MINKTDLAYKKLIGRRVTSEDKNYFEEYSDTTIQVHLDDVWTDDIPSDPAVAVAAGIAEVRTLFAMTEDVTVGDHQSWYADNGGVRLKDWIPDKYGFGYRVRLYDSNNNEIFPTDDSDWFFDTPTGILTFSGDVTAIATPFKITGWRYIGTKGADGITPTVPDPTKISSELVAGTSLSGHRVVVVDTITGYAIYADNTEPTHVGRLVGLTDAAYSMGESMNVINFGEVIEPSWSWTIGLPIYLSTSGLLTQTPPTTGFVQQVGVAVSQTKVIVNILTPIILI